MNDLARAMLGLRDLAPGGEGVRFEFAHALPAWGWALVIAAAGVAAGWSYAGLEGRRGARSLLAVLRGLVLVLLAVMLAGPRLVKQDERVERDWLVVLADRSASLSIADVPGADGATRIARDAQARAAVEGTRAMWERLAAARNVLWLGFDGGVFDLPGAAPHLPPDLGPAQGRRTDLARAIDAALRRVAARPVAGVVILSDGRSVQAPSRAAVNQLRAERIPVFAVPLGGADAPVDLSIVRVDAPSQAFVEDAIPVRVGVERMDPEGRTRSDRILVRLVDDRTGETLDERELPAGEGWDEESVTLLTRPRAPGSASWSVRLVMDRPDLTEENNRAPVRLEVVDRPIRVLYLDGYPRWEYRYLKNLLVRESSIRSTIQLLASDRRFLQEGSDPIEAIPRSPEEWAGFDVLVVGDLRPEVLSGEQLVQIRELVANRGAGLLWIGGGSSTPWRWQGTVLADLLPFRVGRGDDAVRAWREPVTMTRSPAAERLGVLEMGDPDEPRVRGAWPESLRSAEAGWSLLRYAQRISPGSVKPAAEVLATVVPAVAPGTPGDPGSLSPTPAVLTMRFGAGRVVYVATDEIWRWRYAGGETLPERFWLPMLRLLARDSLARAGAGAILECSPRIARVDQPVRVTLRIADESLTEMASRGVAATARPESPDERQEPASVALLPDDPTRPGALLGGTWTPTRPGTYVVSVNERGIDASARVEVVLPDDELRDPRTDHPLLESLARQTEGRVLDPDRLAELEQALPNRERRVLSAPQIETLWDSPLALTLLMVLLAGEWIGRRLIRLA